MLCDGFLYIVLSSVFLLLVLKDCGSCLDAEGGRKGWILGVGVGGWITGVKKE